MDKTNEEAEAVRTAMSILGRSRSDKKIDALNQNREKLSAPEVRAKMQAAQKARRERERKNQEANPAASVVTQPKRRGRPKKVTANTPDGQSAT